MKFMPFLLLFSVILRPSPASNQPADTPYREHINKFFDLILRHKAVEAVDFIYSTNTWMKLKSDDIAKVKSGFGSLSDIVGEFTGYEPISEQYVGTRYIVSDYIAWYERQPLRFTFRHYKPRDVWIIDAFGYEGDLANWLQEKSKTKHLYKRY
jgi:hypothetical protein